MSNTETNEREMASARSGGLARVREATAQKLARVEAHIANCSDEREWDYLRGRKDEAQELLKLLQAEEHAG